MRSISNTSIAVLILAASVMASLANIQYLNEPEARQRFYNLSQIATGIKNVRPFFEPALKLKEFHSMVYDHNLHTQLSTTFSRKAAEKQGLSSKTCIADFGQLFSDMMTRKYYAYQVLDAMGKPPSAVLQGGFSWIGSYDQCTNITEYNYTTTPKELKFQGKYCMSIIKGPLLGEISPFLAGTGINVGLCVPNSCNAEDLAIITDIVLYTISQYLHLPGPSNNTVYGVGGICAEPAPLITSDIAAIVLCAVILFLVLMGSMHDIIQRVLIRRKSETDKALPHTSCPTSEEGISSGSKMDLVENEVNMHDTAQSGSGDVKVVSPRLTAVKGFFHQFLMSFSAITNAEKLLATHVRKGQLGAVNGIRVLSMWWVILGHTYIFAVGNQGAGLFSNPISLLDLAKRFSFQAIMNATYSVDSFFFLSGLLVSFLLLKELKKSDGKTNWALLYFHRFWRLTPVYMFVLMMYATLVVHIPTGPFMRSLDGSQTQCQKYWWTNLLYINNIYPKNLNEICIGWSWYLANDMQFFIIAPIVIYLLYRFRYVGYSLVAALILMNLIVTGVQAKDPKASGDIYTRPWHRISPYVVGIATGYILYVWENNGRPKIYKICVMIGWCLAIAINMSVLYGQYEPNSTGVEWNEDVTALYTATSRFAWSLGLAWLTFACVTGYGGPIDIFLSWRVWVPLGRLTYCAYLVHPIIMFTYNLSLRQLIYQNDYIMIYLFIAHIVVAYLVAFVVSILVEAPMLGLEKLIFKKKKA